MDARASEARKVVPWSGNLYNAQPTILDAFYKMECILIKKIWQN